MMSKLYSLYEPAQGLSDATSASIPILVFLHGLLGHCHDWDAVSDGLKDFSRLRVDLCGHGRSRQCDCLDMDDCCRQIVQVLKQRVALSQPIILIGYSLGGRIAMYGSVKGWWSGLNVQGVVVEGSNFGLASESERQLRWQNDRRWATRFEQEPIEQVLDDWYQQPVFSTLNYEQRQHLIEQRRDNLGTRIAPMMLATSLAHQPDLLAGLSTQPFPIWYICGEQDKKFRQLAVQSRLPVQIIRQAGHNAHKEQPGDYIHRLREFISASEQPDERNQ